MKKLFRSLLCAALMVMALSASAFAAQENLLISPTPDAKPEKQGDFYVLVNGDYVTFSDAVPQIKNDRSCLPFVAVFEQLGFAEEDMTWNGDTKTVTATKGDVTISLTIGQNQITLVQDGQTNVYKTDVAPYIEPSLSRTYIPFGLVADVLGYKVGWDAEVRAVIIDDVDAILASNTETYELMDQYLAYNQSFYEKNQKVTGSYAMDMTVSGVEEGSAMDMGFLVDGDYEMIMAGSNAFQFGTDMVMDMTMSMDGEDMGDAMTDANGNPMFPMTIDFDMRGDLETGAFYFQSAALCDMLEQPDMAGAWFKLDLAELLNASAAETGIDYNTLMTMALDMAEDMTFQEFLTYTLKSAPLTSVDATTTDTLNGLNVLLGDSAFVKSGSKYVNELSLGEIDEYGTQASMCFTLYTSGSKVNGYSLTMDIADQTVGNIAISASMKGSEMEMSMEFAMDMAEAGSLGMTMEMDGTYQSTNSQPATEPPADATVIDLMALLGTEAAPAA